MIAISLLHHCSFPYSILTTCQVVFPSVFFLLLLQSGEEAITSKKLLLSRISSSSRNNLEGLIRLIGMPKSLSSDTTVEILERLPLVSQLRFRWVCKRWFNLISEFHHIKDHPVILFTCDSRPILYALDCTAEAAPIVNNSSSSSSSSSLQRYVEMDYPIKPPNGSFTVQVLGSCNGLICIQYIDHRNLIYFWNPSTSESKTLPHEEIEFPTNQSNLGDHRTIYGFGCNRTMDEYKLIRTVDFGNVDDMLDPEFKIYTLGTNSWKRIGKQEYISIGQPQFDVQGLHVNGALHWKADLPSSLSSRRTNGIISFDIGDENFRVVPKPDYIKDENFMSSGELHMLRGCLCIFQSNGFGGSKELWMMKDYGVKESWTKLFKTMDPFLLEWETRPLCLCNNDEILMENKGTGDLVLYTPRKDEAGLLDIDRRIQKRNRFHVENYIENYSFSLKQQQPSAVNMSQEEEEAPSNRNRN